MEVKRQLKSRLFPCPMWVSGIRFRRSGLVASRHPYLVLSLSFPNSYKLGMEAGELLAPRKSGLPASVDALDVGAEILKY